MNWRNDLRPAQFRNIPFQVETSSLMAGRRLARHEYPQRDIPYQEDMGRKAREYQVEAFIVGKDYLKGRDALLAAIEKNGPGQLVHPYYGTVWVVVSGDAKITESNSYGGMVKFSITFIEAGKQEEPRSEIDTEFVLLDQYRSAELAFINDFIDCFSIMGKVDFVVRDALDSINQFLQIASTVIGNASWLRRKPFSGLIALLPENLFASMSKPKVLAEGILELVRNTPNENVPALLDFSIPSFVTNNITPSRQAQDDNRTALTNLVVQAASARKIVELSTSEPKTLDDARAVRAEIINRTDDVLLRTGIGQGATNATVQLRTDAIQHFSRQTADLPRLVSLSYQSILPSIVIAHDFYGDQWHALDRDGDMTVRNRIRHPGFVSAGKALQLLSS